MLLRRLGYKPLLVGVLKALVQAILHEMDYEQLAVCRFCMRDGQPYVVPTEFGTETWILFAGNDDCRLDFPQQET